VLGHNTQHNNNSSEHSSKQKLDDGTLSRWEIPKQAFRSCLVSMPFRYQLLALVIFMRTKTSATHFPLQQNPQWLYFPSKSKPFVCLLCVCGEIDKQRLMLVQINEFLITLRRKNRAE